MIPRSCVSFLTPSTTHFVMIAYVESRNWQFMKWELNLRSSLGGVRRRMESSFLFEKGCQQTVPLLWRITNSNTQCMRLLSLLAFFSFLGCLRVWGFIYVWLLKANYFKANKLISFKSLVSSPALGNKYLINQSRMFPHHDLFFILNI